jgi:hypothetical protein
LVDIIVALGIDDEDRLRSGKIFKVGFRSTFVQIGPDRSHTKFPTSRTEFRCFAIGISGDSDDHTYLYESSVQ